jgi:heme-degrading monooxygenase HmoA
MAFISKTPKPPYYAVIFTSINADVDHVEHVAMSGRMVELAATYDGFLGIEPARNADGSGVSAIYWKDTESIAAFPATLSIALRRRRDAKSGIRTT